MEIMKFLVLCVVLVTKCVAIENQTVNLEESKIQKREKQYLLEDDLCDGPSVKRDERQSPANKANIIENATKIQPKLNMRLKPKIVAVPLKPILKPTVITKPMNIRIDTSPQRIPTKIPVILKTAKVMPSAAHALRLKMLDNIKNGSLPRIDTSTGEIKLIPNKENQSETNRKDDISFTIENKLSSRTGSDVSPNKEVGETTNKAKQATLNENAKVNLKEIGNTDNCNTVTDTENTPNKGLTKPLVIVESNFRNANDDISATPSPKPIQFFIDEADPVPPLVKKRTKPENQGTKNNDVPSKVKELPIPRKVSGTANDSKNKDTIKPDIVHISNGTHIITIKKIHDKSDKTENLHSRDNFDESRLHTEERIVNHPVEEKPKPSSGTEEESVVVAVGTDNQKDNKYSQKNNKAKSPNAKDPNDCIVITNHDYEEFEERTTLAPPILSNPQVPLNTYDTGSQDSWKYIQNLYCNPYYPIIYDNYRRYYGGAPNGQTMYNQVNNGQHITSPEYTQVYNDPNNYQVDYNVDNNGDNPDIGATYCPEQYPDTLDRIWRSWKDVEIKIRKSENDEPADIDIRRNILDDKFNNGEIIGNIPIPYAQPIGFNGYYNNQNSAFLYPYMNPTYRYLH